MLKTCRQPRPAAALKPQLCLILERDCFAKRRTTLTRLMPRSVRPTKKCGTNLPMLQTKRFTSWRFPQSPH